jgi:hypothetical protein
MKGFSMWVMVMVFNATFNNISAKASPWILEYQFKTINVIA